MRLNKPGTYAVVESTDPVRDPKELSRSQYFLPYKKETISLDPLVHQFFLVDVETFAAPVCMVPDLGRDEDAYLRIQPWTKWLELYQKWLIAPYENIKDILDNNLLTAN